MASPIVCVLKGRSGVKGVRLCCDYRYLNKFTRGDAYAIPDIPDVIHKVGAATYTSCWDAHFGYWELQVKPEHRWSMAFVTDFVVFEWVRMPFGLKCASNSFIRAVNAIMQPINSLTPMLTIWQLFRWLGVAFATCPPVSICDARVSLTLKLEKCQFAKLQVTFVGHIIASGRHASRSRQSGLRRKYESPHNEKRSSPGLGLLLLFSVVHQGFRGDGQTPY